MIMVEQHNSEEEAVPSSIVDDSGNNNEDDSDSHHHFGRRLHWWNVLAFVLNVLVTYGVGTMGWFGTATNMEISEKYQVGQEVD